MDKPIVQERGKDAEAAELRKLNMEEKRKLEKLVIADIDSATARFDAVTNSARLSSRSLSEHLLQTRKHCTNAAISQ